MIVSMNITTTSPFSAVAKTLNQSIIAGDLPAKKESIDNFIQNDGVVLAICGGFQLLGQYYIEASGRRIEGLGVMGHYTLNQTNNRFIGDIKIHNEEFDETYYVCKPTKASYLPLR